MSTQSSREKKGLSHLIEETTACAQKRNEAPFPSEENIATGLSYLREILFPGCVGLLQTADPHKATNDLIQKAEALLTTLLLNVTHVHGKDESWASDIAEQLLGELSDLRVILTADTEAALRGDPAALTVDNVILNYPGFRALTIFRIAHSLHVKNVPLVPRQMTELAHRETGIDIHPGATIGKGFFIDHGTGVVIGETTEIGENVRIYQGVTLGASTDPVKAGRTKRHPTLGDNVTCYANSGVFGPVVIGDNTIIGAGADVFEDTPKNMLVRAPKVVLEKLERRSKPNT